VKETMDTYRNIPFFNYSALFKAREEEIMEVLHDVLARGAYILQKDLQEFKQNVGDFLGVKHVFGAADGTNALKLALLAAGIGPGDEVILPSHTYVATAAAV
jgi:dTDP-4-amino-4,6-dideoxygalactose transaminase